MFGFTTVFVVVFILVLVSDKREEGLSRTYRLAVLTLLYLVSYRIWELAEMIEEQAQILVEIQKYLVQ